MNQSPLSITHGLAVCTDDGRFKRQRRVGRSEAIRLCDERLINHPEDIGKPRYGRLHTARQRQNGDVHSDFACQIRFGEFCMNYVKFAILPQASTTINIQPFITPDETHRGETGSRITLPEESV
ncbi:hypothetical protein [Pectobacterium versatile]|uniref:hypothetical protein n=1 Tax=Pectobacterium versatile TaxID=2488639 RepID=UPI001F0327C5|nr:hypothetical protein [Pectobacterium versatile]